MVYGLQQGTVYGPVASRRYGRSLGVNLAPCRAKMCSFDCVYCHYGRTRRLGLDMAWLGAELPTVEQVVHDLERALPAAGELDLITFSGNGEPTLHPDFPALVDEVRRLRDRLAPRARTALLSNSTGLLRPEVRAALPRLDLPILKLDAGTEATFLAVNRPAPGVDFAELTRLLAAQEGICLQTVLLDGEPANTAEEELAATFELVARIRPREVHLHSIDRPTAVGTLRLVPRSRLEELAARGERETGVPFRAFAAS